MGGKPVTWTRHDRRLDRAAKKAQAKAAKQQPKKKNGKGK